MTITTRQVSRFDGVQACLLMDAHLSFAALHESIGVQQYVQQIRPEKVQMLRRRNTGALEQPHEVGAAEQTQHRALKRGEGAHADGGGDGFEPDVANEREATTGTARDPDRVAIERVLEKRGPAHAVAGLVAGPVP